jgi:hypothetical protein
VHDPQLADVPVGFVVEKIRRQVESVGENPAQDAGDPVELMPVGLQRRSQPGRSPGGLPSDQTGRPVPKTYSMPAAGRVGSAKLARSMTLSASNTQRSA